MPGLFELIKCINDCILKAVFSKATVFIVFNQLHGVKTKNTVPDFDI